VKKKVLLSVILLIFIGGGISYYFWDKEVKAQKAAEELAYQEKLAADELAYEEKLADTLLLLEKSTTNSAILASTYQEYWGAIINGGIPFPKLSNGLGIDEEVLRGMTDYSTRGHFRHNVSGLKQGEFNIVIQMVELAKTEDANQILEEHQGITSVLSELKGPAAKYEDLYNDILEIYEQYDTFAGLATAPSGSYVEYSKNINALYDNISSKIATAKLKFN